MLSQQRTLEGHFTRPKAQPAQPISATPTASTPCSREPWRGSYFYNPGLSGLEEAAKPGGTLPPPPQPRRGRFHHPKAQPVSSERDGHAGEFNHRFLRLHRFSLRQHSSNMSAQHPTSVIPTASIPSSREPRRGRHHHPKAQPVSPGRGDHAGEFWFQTTINNSDNFPAGEL